MGEGGRGVLPGQTVLGLRLDSCWWKCRSWGKLGLPGAGSSLSIPPVGQGAPSCLLSSRAWWPQQGTEGTQSSLGRRVLAGRSHMGFKGCLEMSSSSSWLLSSVFLLRLINWLRLSCSSLRLELLTAHLAERGGTNMFPGRPPLWIVG